ncbi:MAG: GMC family oxidoreductase [Burkholderiaceae bacterium]|nr:GMC family oxidoreductase [Burkholderiaceae bacterium]
MSNDDFDVVIVGAGAGGAAAAWALCEKGAKVLVLEAGPVFDPVTDYRLHRSDWERSAFPVEKARHQGRYRYAPMQALDPAWDDLRSWNVVAGRMNAGQRRNVYRYHHVRGVGGTTLHFQGDAHRLHPESMRMGTRFGVAADWPFDYDTLEPYYEIAERIVGVAGPGRRSLRRRRSEHPLPAHSISYASRRIVAAGTALGMHWEPNSQAILSKPYDGRPGCNYCANCARGCPRADKGSVDVTFMRKARESGRCTLHTDAPVRRLEPGPDGRIRAVVVESDGRRERIRTRVLVLACGAVETPRLLLLSQGTYAPHGVANENGLVGRHFMETLSWLTTAVHPERLGSFRGVPSDVVSWTHNAPDAVPGAVGGCRFAAGAIDAGFVGPIAHATRAIAGWGAAHKRAMRESFGRLLSVSAIGEFLPNEDSYVDLDPAERDEAGDPVARIHSHLPESELRRLRFMATKCRDVVRESGAHELVEEYGTWDFFSATHVFGTCRMGTREDASVVDPTGRAHRWRNLYVADASVFPSSGGGGSPSLTIEALAIRIADAIAAALARRET